MPRYLEVAAEANKVAVQLVGEVDEELRPKVAELVARLVNFGIRCSPRPVQSTVRLNAVKAAVRGLPVKVDMVQKTDERTGKTFNALMATPIYPDGAVQGTMEGVAEFVDES